jgi:hypothetical protein
MICPTSGLADVEISAARRFGVCYGSANFGDDVFDELTSVLSRPSIRIWIASVW